VNTLAYSRTGSGDPLVLLHGIGSSRKAWDPVVPALARHFDVIAVDLPGFGESPALPPEVEPTPAALADAVAALLDHLGLRTPHVAGNSLGGWVTLELAARGDLASVTLLSPAGLWRRVTPLYANLSLRLTHWLSVHARGALGWAVGSRAGRVVVLAQVLGRPQRMTAAQARQGIRAMAMGPGFDAALRASLSRRYLAGPGLDVPVTVAFGNRDRLLLRRQSRQLDQLPAGTRVAELPGCGHVPMTDDPAAVAALVLQSATRAVRAPSTS
jgi:pimeloyl-ACP methyl ester carboxylesterase